MRHISTILFLILFISCQGESTSKPEKIYLGQDTCERCKMIISEKKFASEYRISKNRTKKFDDIGCMVKYILEEEPVDKKKITVFVADYDTGKWLRAENAIFVHSKKIRTPMNFGIIAFKNEKDAREFVRKDNGSIIGGYQQLMDFL